MKIISLLLPIVFALAACSADEKNRKTRRGINRDSNKSTRTGKALEDTLQRTEDERRKTLEAAEQ